MDTYTEFTKRSWSDRFKNAIFGFIFAPFFFFAGYSMLEYGERRHAATTIALKDIIHVVFPEENAADGNLVHLTDKLRSTDKWLIDSLTGIDLKTIKLYRKVYTWQWVETTREKTTRTITGGEKTETVYEYDTRWVSDYNYHNPNKLGHDYETRYEKFKYREGHENPENRPYVSKVFEQKEITLGQYILDEPLHQTLLNFELLPLSLALFPTLDHIIVDTISKAECPWEEIFEPLKRRNESKSGVAAIGGTEKFTTSSLFLGDGNPEIPIVGDSRIEYWHIPDGIYSAVAKKMDGHLTTLENDSLFMRSDLPCGGKVHLHNNRFSLFFADSHSIAEIFKTTHKENDILFIVLRFGGLLFVVTGFLLFGNPLRILFGWIPFLGVIWETVVFKIMQLIGTLVATGISVFYFLKYNSISNLTIYDFYFGVVVLLFLFFANNLRVSVRSGGSKIYGENF